MRTEASERDLLPVDDDAQGRSDGPGGCRFQRQGIEPESEFRVELRTRPVATGRNREDGRS